MDKISKADGGPAFPLVRSPVGLPDQQHWGMTLRDYFAACAMQALIAPGAIFDDNDIAKISKAAYAVADGFLAERESMAN